MENFGLLKNGSAGILKSGEVHHNINGPVDLIEKVQKHMLNAAKFCQQKKLKSVITFTGFDTDGIDYRIYTGWRFGKIGLGHDGINPEYTIGATYDIIDNIALDLEFIMADDNSNSMRMGLNINFGVITPIPEN